MHENDSAYNIEGKEILTVKLDVVIVTDWLQVM